MKLFRFRRLSGSLIVANFAVAVWGLERFAFSIICENRVRPYPVARKFLPGASQNDRTFFPSLRPQSSMVMWDVFFA